MSESDPRLITSLNNPAIRRLARYRDNRRRRQGRRVIVDGWRECVRAFQAGLRLCGLYLPHSGADPGQQDSVDPAHIDPAHQDGAASLISHARSLDQLYRVAGKPMQRISYGQSPRGVVAEFLEPDRSLKSLTLPPVPLVLILDQVEKPGNVGAVFRCADAAGLDAVLLCRGPGDLFNPNAIRSSLGAVFTVPAAIGSEDEIAEFLMLSHIRAVAARVESSRSLWETDLTGPLAIIVGSEADGLGDRWQTLGDQAIEGIHLPMAGVVDSLNVSVSAAVLAYEAVRVRR